MSIEKQYTAFKASGYRDIYLNEEEKQISGDRFVHITMHDGYNKPYNATFTAEEAKQIIQEIEAAIKESKKKHLPF